MTDKIEVPEALGCFEAAMCEGWAEAIREGNVERIRDLWHRRLSFAYEALLREAAQTEHGRSAAELDLIAQGRSEAVAMILQLDPEEGLDDCTITEPTGEAGEYSTIWNEDKLHALFKTDDRVWSLVLKTLYESRPADEELRRDAEFPWDCFPSWLIDHHEGDELTEELLQRAAADMIAAIAAEKREGSTPEDSSADRTDNDGTPLPQQAEG